MLTKHSTLKPRILCLSGLDPTGGAGIQADIETLLLHNCHCLPMVTLNSVQDSQGVYQIVPTHNELLWQQFEKLQEDGNIAAIKIGMLANAEQIEVISKIIKHCADIPVVLDPVFGSGLGTSLAKDKQIHMMRTQLLKHCTLITPNTIEAKQLNNNLSPQDDLTACARSILEAGAKQVLITGTHDQNINNEKNQDPKIITHHLYSPSHSTNFQVERLRGNYHGSGCTLASAICANLAQQQSINLAIENALAFTQQSLLKAQSLGKHQLFPNRWLLEKNAQ